MKTHICLVCYREYSGPGKKEYPDTCGNCIKLLEEEAPMVPITGVTATRYWDLDAAIQELEDRIPELFVGEVCPGDCTCTCTYVEGCQLLKHGKRKARGVSKKQLTTP